jgi:hypothetical protein
MCPSESLPDHSDWTPFDPPDHMPQRLDALERVAAQAVENTYGPMLDDEARGWVQKGIEGMRYAVAKENEDA